MGIRIEGVAAGLWHTVCVSADGDVYAFGGNQFGQLGTGDDQAEVCFTLCSSHRFTTTAHENKSNDRFLFVASVDSLDMSQILYASIGKNNVSLFFFTKEKAHSLHLKKFNYNCYN